MSSDPIIIGADNIGKSYAVYSRPQDRLKQLVFGGSKKYYREFWALQNVSFEIRKGEAYGIVGRNGAGKSTLLQLIAGTLKPTEGKLSVNGRIAPLLELGTGFNPEFTGFENIFLSASILGFSRQEIDQKLDAILDFADIGDFVKQPVKTYSSGMFARLAFAIYSILEPEIFIVDEIIAVGDAKFQARCFKKFDQLKERGTTILFVSHSSEQILKNCSRSLLLEKGQLLCNDTSRVVMNKYYDLLFGKEAVEHNPEELNPASSQTETNNVAVHLPQGLDHSFIDHGNTEEKFSTRTGYNAYEHRWGDRRGQILDYYFKFDDELYPSHIKSKGELKIGIKARFSHSVVNPILGLAIKTKEGSLIYGLNSEESKQTQIRFEAQPGQVIYFEFQVDLNVAPGDYFVSIGIASLQGEDIVPHDRRYDSLHIVVSEFSSIPFQGVTDLSGQIRLLD